MGEKMEHDRLSDAFSGIDNAERAGKRSCKIRKSKLVEKILKLLKKDKYIKGFRSEGSFFEVKLSGRINKCKVIRPRFSFKNGELEKWEKRYLPARGIGILIVTTPQGILDHKKVEKKELGGRLLGYVY